MAVKKLSQIATAPSPPAPTDQLVGVQGGVADVLFPISQISSGATYLVGTGGNFTTIAQVNAATFAPGDSILFQGGQTFSGAIISPSGGTPANPITFGSYGGGQATISSGNSNGFTSTDQPGIIVRDLTFTGTASTNHGILFQNTLGTGVHLQNIQAINCNVSGYGQNGIFATGSANGSGYDDILFQGNTENGCCTVAFNGKGTAGIIVQNVASFGIGTNPVSFRNVIIEDCESLSNLGCADTNWTGSGIFVAQTSGGRISNSRAYLNGANANNTTGGGGPCGIWTSDSNGVLIVNPISKFNSTATTADGCGVGIDEGCIDCHILNPTTEGNAGPGLNIFSGSDAGVTKNDKCSILGGTSINDGGGTSNAAPCSILIGGDNAVSTNYRVAGVTVYQSNANTRALMFAGSQAAAMTGLVEGNQFIVTGTQPFVYTTVNPSGVTFNGNRYISPTNSVGGSLFTSTFNVTWNNIAYGDLGAWTAATNQEKTGLLSVGNIFAGGDISAKAANVSLNLLDTESGGHEWQIFTQVHNGNAYIGWYDNTARSGLGVTLQALGFDGNYSVQYVSGAAIGWSSNANFADAAAMDTGISRSAANTIAMGNGTPGDASAALKANSLSLGDGVNGEYLASTNSGNMFDLCLSNFGFPTARLALGATNTGGYFFVQAGVFGTRDIFLQAAPDSSAGWGAIEAIDAAGLQVGTGGGATPVVFNINRVEKARLTAAGSFVLQSGGALATNATDGFTYIPTCAGTPTGTPTTQTGAVPLVYDTTNNQLWIYAGAWKQPKTLVGAGVVDWQ